MMSLLRWNSFSVVKIQHIVEFGIVMWLAILSSSAWKCFPIYWPSTLSTRYCILLLSNRWSMDREGLERRNKIKCPYQPHMMDTIQLNKRTTERSTQKCVYIHAKNNRDGSTLITIERATFTRHPNHNQTYLTCHFASVKVVVDWPDQMAFPVKWQTKSFEFSKNFADLCTGVGSDLSAGWIGCVRARLYLLDFFFGGPALRIPATIERLSFRLSEIFWSEVFNWRTFQLKICLLCWFRVEAGVSMADMSLVERWNVGAIFKLWLRPTDAPRSIWLSEMNLRQTS